jgi:site-specific recombinase XerC
MTFNQGVAGSRTARPTRLSSSDNLLTEFLNSRLQGISPRTTEFYETYITPFVNGYDLTPNDINSFLANLSCNNGRNAYYRAIRAFCNWLYRQGYIDDNPITRVDPPKMTKVILPSLTPEQVDYLIDNADNVRDKAIISLFADSGIRLNELMDIREGDVDLASMIVTVWGKGGKQRKAS